MSATADIPNAAVLANALRAHQQGDLEQAEALYREVLSAEPENPQALQYLGLLHEHRGDLDGATANYEDALRHDPSNVRLLNRLATTLGQSEHYEAAERRARGALDLQPDFAPAWVTLGNVLDGVGRLDEAVKSFREALRLEPDEPQIHNNLGIVLARLGLVDEAETHYRRAIEAAPEFVDALSNLGTLLSRQGKFPDSLEVLERAVERAPNSAAVLTNLGEVMGELGEMQSAHDLFTRALSIDPELRGARIGLIRLLAKGGLTRYQTSVDRLLETAYGWSGIGLDDLGPLTAHHFKKKYGRPLRRPDERETELGGDQIRRLAGDRLLAIYLRKTINADRGMEVMLTRLRRELADWPNLRGDAAIVELTGALAQQCGANEYIFSTTDDEANNIAAWRAELEAVENWTTPTDAVQETLLRYCLYAAPRQLSCREAVAAATLDAWWPALRPVIEEEVHNRLNETEIAADLRALTPIEDAISLAVARQYEENPYPRWATFTRRPADSTAAVIKNLFPHFEPPDFLRGAVDVLIAGCGTGQHPIAEAALVYRDSRVLAIDLSRTSLAYAKRRATELGVDNVEFAVADILEFGGLGHRFDLIEAGGVLHHMAEPKAGLRILADLLKPGGVMMVALYSRRSRRHIATLRERVAEEGLQPAPATIRSLRSKIFFDPGYADYRGLLESSDFYSTSACRDLMFHVQEHHFSLPEIGTMLAALDLDLIGLQHRSPDTARLYREAFPEDATQTDLTSWDRFEASNPKTFAQMYHVWCQKRR